MSMYEQPPADFDRIEWRERLSRIAHTIGNVLNWGPNAIARPPITPAEADSLPAEPTSVVD